MLDYTKINSETWDSWAEEGFVYTLPISHKEYEKTTADNFAIYLTPCISVPHEWFGELKGKKVLGLASGGGQQMPVLSKLGVECTVFDYSDKQLEAVNDGLKRDDRQIVLIKDADSIIGFFQYYTNADTFMMEEIQFKPEYQGKNIFRSLYGFLIPNIKEDTKFVEAYASTTNHKSMGILGKLGLAKIGINKNGRSFHFRGNYSDLIKWYKSK